MYARVCLYTLLGCCGWLQLLSPAPLLCLALLSYLLTGGNYTLYLLYHTLGRDARGAYRYLRLLLMVYVYQKMDWTVPQVFQRTVKRHPEKVCLYFEDESWTFRQVIFPNKRSSIERFQYSSWMNTVTDWLTSCLVVDSSTGTPWPSSWRTSQSMWGCG